MRRKEIVSVLLPTEFENADLSVYDWKGKEEVYKRQIVKSPAKTLLRFAFSARSPSPLVNRMEHT